MIKRYITKESMSERSFELAKQNIIGTSKYDYFIVGIGAATFAFFAKNFEFLIFGLNEKTLVLIALLLLILSIVSGLKKIDVYNFFVEKNGKILDQKEKRAGYIKSCETQTVYINEETGEIVSPDNSEIKAIGMQVVIERWVRIPANWIADSSLIWIT